MSLSGIDLCIFDVNGVLIDSNQTNAAAMARAFTDNPDLKQRIVTLYLTLTGIDRGTKIRMIQERIIGRPFEENEFELRWKAFGKFGRLSMVEAPQVDGCTEVLAELGRRKIKRAALSNTPQGPLEDALAIHELDSLLDIIRGGGDWPKSESLARFLLDYRLDPGRCLFFGDGKGDLAAARYAGVSFTAIDPGRGEFADEEGFNGPYGSLADWGKEELWGRHPE